MGVAFVASAIVGGALALFLCFDLWHDVGRAMEPLPVNLRPLPIAHPEALATLQALHEAAAKARAAQAALAAANAELKRAYGAHQAALDTHYPFPQKET